MKFNIISETGYGLGLATHLSSEGHSVAMCLRQPSDLGSGLVNITEDTDHADITIFDSDAHGRTADEARKEGKRVLGASHWAELLEKDSEYAHSVIEAVGWNTSAATKGVNFYVTTWFNGAHFLVTYCSLVYHRFMSSGRGPEVRTTGVVSNFYQPTERVYKDILRPLEAVLRRTNHRGCCHVHLLVDGDSYTAKGLSASFNTPLALLLFENSRAATSDVLLRLLNESSKPIQVLEQWAAALLITVPPYPYTIDAHSYELAGLQPPALKHLWLIDAKRDGSAFKTAKAHGKIGYVTARGSYLQEAVKRAYRTVRNLEVRDLQYRDDVGRNLNSLISKLKEYQWMK